MRSNIPFSQYSTCHIQCTLYQPFQLSTCMCFLQDYTMKIYYMQNYASLVENDNFVYLFYLQYSHTTIILSKLIYLSFTSTGRNMDSNAIVRDPVMWRWRGTPFLWIPIHCRTQFQRGLYRMSSRPLLHRTHISEFQTGRNHSPFYVPKSLFSSYRRNTKIYCLCNVEMTSLKDQRLNQHLIHHFLQKNKSYDMLK